jgi:hypothetical protein
VNTVKHRCPANYDNFLAAFEKNLNSVKLYPFIARNPREVPPRESRRRIRDDAVSGEYVTVITSRERVTLALCHKEADRIPIDLGGSAVSGMHVDEVYLLRQALGLDPSGTPVKVIEPFQMLGEIKSDLLDALGIDVVALEGASTVFGFKNEGWKPWTTFAGTPVLVPGGFNTEAAPNGDILLYPEGDLSSQPSGRMPKGGFFFDIIVRQPEINDDDLNVEDNLQEFGPISEAELTHFQKEADRLYTETDKAILANFGGTDIGEAAPVSSVMLRHPKGIRSYEAWLESIVTRRDYLYEVCERQCAIGLANLNKLHAAVGERITAVLVAAMDFGMQTGPILSPKVFRDLYKPFYKQINGWIHEHTSWKTFIHSCGSVNVFLDDFIDSGFDILNPVQCSAANMDPRQLKKEFGDRLVFWGGGVDTQCTFPFGTTADVRREVRERMEIFGHGGGFVFNTTHNVQPCVPVENVVAMYETVLGHGKYPLRH